MLAASGGLGVIISSTGPAPGSPSLLCKKPGELLAGVDDYH